MDTCVERLRDFLSARNECLSGHELARPNGLNAMELSDELSGAALLAAALVEQGVAPASVRAALALPAAAVGEESVHAVLEHALGTLRLDVLVQQLDDTFDLESRSRMAP